MSSKQPWYEIEPRNAVNIQLPHPDVQGPYTQEGSECPWPWEPIQLKGAPLGQYHCQYCGEMCVAGMEHVDFGAKDADGLNQMDRDYIAWEKQQMEMEQNDASNEEFPGF